MRLAVLMFLKYGHLQKAVQFAQCFSKRFGTIIVMIEKLTSIETLRRLGQGYRDPVSCGFVRIQVSVAIPSMR